MRTLLNKDGNQSENIERPANPFKVFIRWGTKEAIWKIRTGGETKELKKPLRVIVVDAINFIGGGRIGYYDIWSHPGYRLKSQETTVWCKDIKTGKIAKIGEGPIEAIYDKLKIEYEASKTVKVYCFLPQTGQSAIIDLSGYSISPFYSLDQDLAENPAITLEVDSMEVPNTPKAWGKCFSPIITTGETDEKEIGAAIKEFTNIDAINFLKYELGEEAEKPEAEEATTEEETKKNSEPWQ